MLSDQHKLCSMTGIGQARISADYTVIDVVVRSVNSRGLDIKMRLPKELAFLEADLQAKASKMIARGRLDIAFNLEEGAPSGRSLIFDEAKAAELLKQLAAFADRHPAVKSEITLGQLLSLGQLFVEKDQSSPSGRGLKKIALEALEQALEELRGARQREGQLLAPFLDGSLNHCQALVGAIMQRCDSDAKRRFSAISSRVNELFSRFDLNQERIYQECALLAERSDFKEEIDRLNAHLEHFANLCSEAAPKGRKLDFLCQEMLRESGTLLTKAFEHAVMASAIELKAEIERLREQVQNIE